MKQQSFWDTLLQMLCRDCENAPRWTNNEWLDLLHEGSDKKRFQCCLNSDSFIHHLRAIRGHSGGNRVDPVLLDSVKIPHLRSEYLYHVGSSLCMHSIIPAGLIAGGKDAKEGRQTVFFKAVDPMTGSQEEEYQDVSKITKSTQQEHAESVSGCHTSDQSGKDSRKKIRNGQTRPNAILLDDSVPADCVEKVVNTKTKEDSVSESFIPESKVFTSGSRARRRANTRIFKASASSQKSPEQGCINRRSAANVHVQSLQ